MPKGLRIPIGANPGGGLATVDSDENDRKIIRTALSSDDNENAFQQNIGLGEEMIFSLADPTSRAKIVRKINEIFQRFEAQKRYRLVDGTVRWREDSAKQTTSVSFKYLNLESDRVEDFNTGFDAAGRVTVPTGS